VELLVGVRGGALDVLIDVVSAGGAEPGGDRQPLEVIHTFDGGVVRRHTDAQTGLVVRAGEVHRLAALVGDGDAGDGDVEGAGLQTGDDAVEVGGLQLDVETDAVGDLVDDVDVEADVLAVLLELERHEGGVRSHGVAVFEAFALAAFVAAAAGQARGDHKGRSHRCRGRESLVVFHEGPFLQHRFRRVISQIAWFPRPSPETIEGVGWCQTLRSGPDPRFSAPAHRRVPVAGQCRTAVVRSLRLVGPNRGTGR